MPISSSQNILNQYCQQQTANTYGKGNPNKGNMKTRRYKKLLCNTTYKRTGKKLNPYSNLYLRKDQSCERNLIKIRNAIQLYSLSLDPLSTIIPAPLGPLTALFNCNQKNRTGNNKHVHSYNNNHIHNINSKFQQYMHQCSVKREKHKAKNKKIYEKKWYRKQLLYQLIK